ncbi:hypothetical protein PS683_01448 [Pseudomonas fluorescens]|jgi:hypothetical protein|uniref:Uncharacterized protein n=1 Tax=Pseudomonas fluorescens TaxID=294 RepID=A0A5E6R7T4_PSEFL|nr:hypothetical protein PS683_01448 [Pseudomonas fluorescens]VVM64010.1 hypothetical protein PS683_01448 [Pseudomonas fluorescens]
MIEYLTCLSRATETNVAPYALPQGKTCAPHKPQPDKWESWLNCGSDISLNSWLKVRKSLSERS